MAFVPLALIGALLAGAPAQSEDGAAYADRLAVLPIVIEGPHGRARTSAIFDAVASASRLRMGLRLISGEEMFVASREGLADRVRDCGSDDVCIASRLRAFNARLGLVVVLSFEVEPVLLSLQLLDTDAQHKVAESVEELTGISSEAAIAERISEEVDRLLERAGYVKSGRILVEVDPPGARVSIAGGHPADDGAPHVFTLPPGRYTVFAAHDGYASATQEVSVTTGMPIRIAIELQAESSIFESPWLWVAVGALVVGGTSLAIVAASSPSYCLCTTLGGAGCETCN